MKKLVFLVVLSLVVAACGGEDSGDDVASLEGGGTTLGPEEASEERSTEEALLEFSACMRDQGVDMADPTVDAEGNVQIQPPQGTGAEFDFDEIQPALEECQDLLEEVTFGFEDADFTELEDTLLEFASCMRENGYDMDDPDLSAFAGGGGGGDDAGPAAGGPFGQIDQDDPAFQAASAACEDILAGIGGFGPGPRG